MFQSSHLQIANGKTRRESCRLRCVVVCDLETSWMRGPWPAVGCSGTKKDGLRCDLPCNVCTIRGHAATLLSTYIKTNLFTSDFWVFLCSIYTFAIFHCFPFSLFLISYNNNNNNNNVSQKFQRLEAAQMKFLRHLLGITKLDKEKNQCIREKTGAQNIVKKIKLPEKVATTRTEDGQK